MTPVPNVKVQLLPLNIDVTTAADGRFRFDFVPITQGPFDLQAIEVGTEGLLASIVDIVLATDGETLTQNLIIDGKGTVTGTVFNPDGSLATAVNVTLSSFIPGFPTRVATTDATGTYTILNVPQGEFIVIATNRPLRFGGTESDDILDDGEVVIVDVQMLEEQVPALRSFVDRLFDANNFAFDVQKNGTIIDGTTSVYFGDGSVNRGGLRLFNGEQATITSVNGQISLSEAGPSGLQVTRKVYIPSRGYFARYLEIVSNPTATPVSVDMRVDSHFRFIFHVRDFVLFDEPPRIISTSSGDATLGPADRWVVIDDNRDVDALAVANLPSMAHVFDGPGGQTAVGNPSFEQDLDARFGRLRTAWENVTVPPGQTVIIMHFAVQQTTRSAAQASAERLVQLPPEALALLTPEERSQIVNFAVPADGSSPLAALPALDGDVDGFVFEHDGTTPVPGGSVKLRSSHVLFDRPVSAVVGADGSYLARSCFTPYCSQGRKRVIPLTAYSVTATHPVARVESPAAAGDFSPPSTMATTDIIFSDSGLITGIVRRQDGTVASLGSVELVGGGLLLPVSVPIGIDGRYIMGGVMPGTYSVVASLPSPQGSGGLAGSATAIANIGQTTNVDITLTAAGGVVGTVRSISGSPAVNVRVELTGPDFLRATLTDTGGRYAFLDTPTGTFTLQKFEPNTALSSSVQVSIVQGQLITQDLTLVGLGSVEVTATFSDGSLAADAPIQIFRSAGGGVFVSAGTTQSDGTRTVTSVPIGAFTIRVLNPVTPGLFGEANGTISSAGDVVQVAVVIPLDAPPSVTLTSPTTNAFLAAGVPFTISTTATDDDRVEHVEFVLAGVSVAVDETSPYTVNAQLSPGPDGSLITIQAIVTDSSGQTRQDAIGVIRATDSDGDGLRDNDEAVHNTDPANPDSDADGLLDGAEVNTLGTEPDNPDTDGDGLNDGDEVNTQNTDPINPDTDSDGLSDGAEIAAGADPLNPDTDGDGLSDGDEVNTHNSDPLKPDTDDDGVSDAVEVFLNCDPTVTEVTTVIGRTVSLTGTPLANVEVQAGGVIGSSDSAGEFSLPAVAACISEVRVFATGPVDGSGLKGVSAATPVVIGGTTDVGDISLVSKLGALYPGLLTRLLTFGGDLNTFVTTELNGDSFPDLVIAEDQQILVRFGTGDGLFQDGFGLSFGAQLFDVAAADLNGDNFIDVVAVGVGGVFVSLGNGDGTFQPIQNFAAGALPREVVIAQIDGDGLLDLVVLSDPFSALGELVILLGNGDGTFQSGQNILLGDVPNALAVADLNGDTLADLVVANRDTDDVFVFFANGAGTFQPGPGIAVGEDPTSIAIADINTDNIPDLIVTNEDTGDASVLLGNGDGSFQPEQRLNMGVAPSLVLAVDINADSLPDIVVANEGSSDVSVRLANGNGTFQPETRVAAGGEPFFLTVADVDNDTRPDLVVMNSRVFVVFGNGDGSFVAAQRFSTLGNDPLGADVVDLNGDGLLDVVTANDSTSDISVMLADVNGGFQPEQRFTLSDSPTDLVVDDLNGDGVLDLVTTNFASAPLAEDHISVFLGIGDGTFLPGPSFVVGEGPRAVAVADLNGDGQPDVVTANSSDDNISVLLGNGDGTFQGDQRFDVGDAPTGVAISDLNGDSQLDLVSANAGSSDISVFLGNGDGSFQAEQRLLTGMTGIIVLGEVDGDGQVDLILAETGGERISVRLGNGDGSFQTAQNIILEINSLQDVALAELNGDGFADLVGVDIFSGRLSIVLGNGDGTFQDPQYFAAHARGYSVSVVDMNADGRPDIIVPTRGDVEIFFQNADAGVGDHDGYQLTNAEERDLGTAPNNADTDADGLADGVEVNVHGTDPNAADTDGDGLTDSAEVNTHGTNPLAVDSDGDGLRDSDEINIHGTDPTNPDTDGDGTVDGAEVSFGCDPSTADVTTVVGRTVTEQGTPVTAATVRARAIAGLSDGSGNFTLANVPSCGVSTIRVVADGLSGGSVVEGLSASFSPLSGGTTDVGDIALTQDLGPLYSGPRSRTGLQPLGLHVADLDGDGVPDAVTANADSDAVSVLLGNGDGSFEAEQRFTAGDDPFDVASADLNLDGQLDLVTANQLSDDISVLLGNGDGSFQAEQRFAAGNGPASIAIADLNLDGQPDAVTVNRNTNDVSVLLGNGDGTFQAELRFSVGTGPRAIAVADVNLDGAPDIATANRTTNDVSVLLGNGDGSFQAEQRLSVGDDPRGITLGLVNADSQPDIVTANEDTDDISVLLGNGDGTFQAEQRIGAGNGPESVTVADVDLDGLADILVGNRFSDDVSVLLGDGTISFVSADIAVGDDPRAVTVANIDLDGRPDIVVANETLHTVSVLLGDGNGGFPASPRLTSRR